MLSGILQKYAGSTSIVHTFTGEWRGWAPSEMGMYYESRQMASKIGYKFLPFRAQLLGRDR